jgi:hypothetical protein
LLVRHATQRLQTFPRPARFSGACERRSAAAPMHLCMCDAKAADISRKKKAAHKQIAWHFIQEVVHTNFKEYMLWFINTKLKKRTFRIFPDT